MSKFEIFVKIGNEFSIIFLIILTSGELKFKDGQLTDMQGHNIALRDRLSSFEETTKTALNVGTNNGDSIDSSDSPKTTPKTKSKSHKNRRKHARK